ncbi:MAG TPA: TIGR04283 family arsenosugar biosynthesis glycosyltransferase [Isosphaeraceae bacterium]|nr:TIGR04283 family arsenosugar biosynthesis glycosyltransferase [Isosphaeraceae bacterium]
MRVSVVIPTWNEAGVIVSCLSKLAEQGADEVIVADGTSPDGTASLAGPLCTRVVSGPRGRGAQQNLGAAAASGDVLLFLHADCWLAPGAITLLRNFLRRHPRSPGGCFRMRVADPDPRFRLIDAAADLRAGLLGIPYGDQGLWVPRWAFERAGGFPETLLMDDVLLALRLRQLGRLALLRPSIHVSPRRWKYQGLLRQSFRNWTLTALAALGVHPNTLSRYYPMIR